MKKILPVLWTIGALCGIAALIAWVVVFKTADPIEVVVDKAFERFEEDMKLSVAAPVESTPGKTTSVGEIVINVKADGTLHVNGQELSDEDLAARVKAIYQAYPDQEVVIRGDAEANFERIISVLDVIKEAGIWNVAFATARTEK